MAPPLPDDVSADELPREVRRELQTLPEGAAAAVARRLAMAARVVEDDPELAYQHTLAAQRMAGRVGAVREATGLAAYAAGHWGVALTELRAAKRITGSEAYLPVMADCERGLGRPERALELAASPEAGRLDEAGKVELRIVASGARRDLGQLDAAVVTLQGADLTPRRSQPWTARLRYAYADALAAAGRTSEAERWFERTLEVDRDGETDAAERLAELQGLTFVDLDDAEDEDAAEDETQDDPEDDPEEDLEDESQDVAGVDVEVEPDRDGGDIDDEEDVPDDLERTDEELPDAQPEAGDGHSEIEDDEPVAAVPADAEPAGVRGESVATVEPSRPGTFSHLEPDAPVAPPAATAPAVVFQPAADAPAGDQSASGDTRDERGQEQDRQEGTLF
ncbi:MAG: hypothetical protein ACTHQ3_10630 [Motilibacteraceae bacterium]